MIHFARAHRVFLWSQVPVLRGPGPQRPDISSVVRFLRRFPKVTDELHLCCVRASCNSSQLSTVPADHAILTFWLFQESCVRDSHLATTLHGDKPNFRQTIQKPENCREHGFATESEPKFVCLKHCGNRGNSDVCQKQHQLSQQTTKRGQFPASLVGCKLVARSTDQRDKASKSHFVPKSPSDSTRSNGVHKFKKCARRRKGPYRNPHSPAQSCERIPSARLVSRHTVVSQTTNWCSFEYTRLSKSALRPARATLFMVPHESHALRRRTRRCGQRPMSQATCSKHL